MRKKSQLVINCFWCDALSRSLVIFYLIHGQPLQEINVKGAWAKCKSSLTTNDSLCATKQLAAITPLWPCCTNKKITNTKASFLQWRCLIADTSNYSKSSIFGPSFAVEFLELGEFVTTTDTAPSTDYRGLTTKCEHHDYDNYPAH